MGGLQTAEEAYGKTEPKLEIAGQTLQCRNEASAVMGRAEHINRQLEAEFWERSERDQKGKVKDEKQVVARSRFLVIFRRERSGKKSMEN